MTAGETHLILTTAAEAAAHNAGSITHNGQVALWVAFAGLFIPMMYMALSSFAAPKGKKYFHIVSFLINAIASVAYLAMANGYGCVWVYGANGYRAFWYARYIDWSLTTPLQLLDLAGLANASSDNTIWLLATDFLMIVSGLIGGLIGGGDKACWGFFVLSMLAYLPIVYILDRGLPHESCAPAARKVYSQVSMITVIFWTAYPAVWIAAEGTGVIDEDAEVILYTVLDIIAKSIFGLIIVSARDGIDAASGPAGSQLLKETEMTPANTPSTDSASV
jgi:bacteriorhodopsin